MAEAMACPYTRYFSSNDRRTLTSFPAPVLVAKDPSPLLLLFLGGRRSPYRVDDLYEGGVRGEHLDRTGPQRLLVQLRVELVGEHQRLECYKLLQVAKDVLLVCPFFGPLADAR